MEGLIKKIYEEHKHLFEVLITSLLVTSLFLNVESPSGWAGKSIGQIKFLLLSLTCLILIFTLYKVTRFFTIEFLENQQRKHDSIRNIVNNNSTITENLNKELEFVSGQVLVVVFSWLIALLIAINFIVYLISSYLYEALAFILFIVAFFIVKKASMIPVSNKGKTSENVSAAIYLVFSFFPMIFAALFYVLVYFNFLTAANVVYILILSIAFAIVSSAILLFILLKY